MLIDTDDLYIDTLNQIKALKKYLDSFEGDRIPPSGPMEMKNPTIRALYLDGTRSMLEKFQREVAEFEAVNPRHSRPLRAEKVLQPTKQA